MSKNNIQEKDSHRFKEQFNTMQDLRKRSKSQKEDTQQQQIDVELEEVAEIPDLVKERSSRIVESIIKGQTEEHEKQQFVPSVQVNEKTGKVEVKIQKSTRVYSKNSLFLLNRSNCVRRFSIKLIEQKYFEYFILSMILGNSLCLALFDYEDRDSLTYRNQVVNRISEILTYIFTVECLLKIIAMGFIAHKGSYIRDGWNIIDFTVVMLGLIEQFVDVNTAQFKSLRIIRVLRPLRSFNAISSIRKLIEALIQALPDFLHVAIFLMFVFLLFAILGVHQFNGVFYNRCRYNPQPETPTTWENLKEVNRVCSQSGLGNYVCPSGMTCGNPAQFGIPLENEDLYNNAQVNFGISNFNNLGTALLTVFHMMTMQAWTEIMLNLMDADFPFLGAFYSIMIVVIISFFLMNLILAVIIQAFIKIQKQEIEKEILKLDLGNNLINTPNQQELLEAKENKNFKNKYGAHLNVAPGQQSCNGQESQAQQEAITIIKSHLNHFGDASETPWTIDMLKEEKKADFSFLKKVAIKSKVLQLLTRGKMNQSFKIRSQNGTDNQASRIEDSTLIQENPFEEILPDQRQLYLQPIRADEIYHENSKQYTDINQEKANTRHQFMTDNSFFHNDYSQQVSSRIVEELQSKKEWHKELSKESERSMNQIHIFKVNSDIPKLPPIEKNVSIYIENLCSPDITQRSLISHKNELNSPTLQFPDRTFKDSSISQISIVNVDSQEYETNKKPKSILRKRRESKSSNKSLKFDNSPKQQEQQQVPIPLSPKAQDPSQRMQNAFRKFLNKKKDEQNQKEQYFNDILAETKSEFLQRKKTVGGQMNLRQLAHQKLGIKIKRQKNNLMKEVERFKIEDRAESNKLFYFSFKLVLSPHFTRAINLLIIVNTIILSLDRYPLEQEQIQIYDTTNTALSLVFIFEMLAKLFAFGLKVYVQDPFNIFDSIIVTSSFVDLIVAFAGLQETSGAITAFRAFRLIRVFKLAKSWKKLQNLLKTMWRTLKDISTFSILLFLFIFIYALIALEIFAYKGRFTPEGKLDLVNGVPPVVCFDGIIYSLSTVFIILTNDGWSDIFFNYYRASGALPAILFFVSLIILGQKILLNLFLAILLENFDESSLNEEIKDKIKRKKQKSQYKSKLQRFQLWVKTICTCARFKKAMKGHQSQDYGGIFDDSQIQTIQKEQNNQTLKESQKDEEFSSSKSQNLSATLIQKRKEKMLKLEEQQEPIIERKALLIFSEANLIRKFCFSLVRNTKFDIFIILVIFISGIQLALETPLNDPNSYQAEVLFYIDVTTTTIFCIEAVLKMIAYGFLFNGRWSYLRQAWNLLDFIIIILSVISLTPLPSELRIVKIFRVVRGLRLVGKNEGIQLAVKALLQAVPQIANVMIITLLFFLIFGIIGVSYFKGKFQYCRATNVAFFSQMNVQNKWDCKNSGGDWVNKLLTFDSIFSAMQTLFVMSTTSGWSEHMFASVNSTEPDDVSIKDNNIIWIFFFILFMVVGALFLLNLFVGVVISTFNREKDKIGGNNLLTDRQKNWIDTKLIALKARPKFLVQKPQNPLRKICFIIQEKPQFESFIYFCIIFNTFVLTIKWFDQPDAVQNATESVNYIFAAIFLIEALIKILALGRHYFKDNWNNFDFIVVIATIASIGIAFFSSFNLGGAATIIRAFRITRIMRLVKRAKNLRLVFHTFIATLPALANVGGLLLLLLYLYAIIGMNLFGQVKRNNNLNANLNFESFGGSFISLFVVATGDAWDGVMLSSIQPKSVFFNCEADPTYEMYVENNYNTVGCGPYNFFGLIFFYSYFLFVNLIFLNLFIAIILQGFEDTQSKDSRLFNQQTLDKFRDCWATYDPDATTFIKISNLKSLLIDLGKPLGWDKESFENHSIQEKFVASLDLPIYNNFSDYMFMDVLEALALRLVVQEQLEVEKEKIKKEQEEQDSLMNDSQQEQNLDDTAKKEEQMKKDIEKDIDILSYQVEAQKIQAVKEVVRGTIKAKMTQKQMTQDNHFTSLHQAAAQVAVSHMKFIIAKRKLFRKIGEAAINPQILVQNKQEADFSLQNQSSLAMRLKLDKLQASNHEIQEEAEDEGYSPNAHQISYKRRQIREQKTTSLQQEEQKDAFPQFRIYQNINMITQISAAPYEEEKVNTQSPMQQKQSRSNLKHPSDLSLMDTVRMNELIDQEISNRPLKKQDWSKKKQSQKQTQIQSLQSDRVFSQKLNSNFTDAREGNLRAQAQRFVLNESQASSSLQVPSALNTASLPQHQFSNNSLSKLNGSMGGTGECADEVYEDSHLSLSALTNNNASAVQLRDQHQHTQENRQLEDLPKRELQSLATAKMGSFCRSRTVSQKEFDLQSFKESPQLDQKQQHTQQVENLFLDPEDLEEQVSSPRFESLYTSK